MDNITNTNNILEQVRKLSRENKLRLRISPQETQQLIMGKEGEKAVSRTLREYFPGMLCLDDVYMDISSLRESISGYGPMMQIDHILISDHVIYVLETKKYSSDAKLSGSTISKTWGYSDNVTNNTSRNNASKQNQNHIKNLMELLKCGNIKMISIVCLVNVKAENISVSVQYGQYVFTLEELPFMISAIEQKYSKIYIEKNVIAEEINKRNIKNLKNEVEHIIYVKLLKRKVKERSKGKRQKKRKRLEL